MGWYRPSMSQYNLIFKIQNFIYWLSTSIFGLFWPRGMDIIINCVCWWCLIPWWGYQLTKTVQNGVPQAISEILHIEYRIVCCIQTYLIHIYHISKCSKCNWNRYIEGFWMRNVHFHINGLSLNYVILMSWPLMAIYFLLLNYWLFSVQVSYHI